MTSASAVSQRPVLVVAYMFPPLGGPGVQRPLAFARYLPEHGFRPVVVAADPSGTGYWAEDPDLAQRVGPSAVVRRVREGPSARVVAGVRRLVPRKWRGDFDRALLIPDRSLPWFRRAVQASLQEGRRHRIKLVFATGAPWTNLLVGATVARLMRVPLVTDFRDPWTDSSVFEPFSDWHQEVHRRLESWVHRQAAHVVVNTASSLRELQVSFPVTIGKSSFIPNGWDELDFARVPSPLPTPVSDRCRVGYAGNFYPGRPVDDALSPFRAALVQRPSLRSSLRLRFIGNTGAQDAAPRFGLADIMEDQGYLPLQEALSALADCEVTLATVPAGARRGWVPQKLYQQLKLGRPILLLAPPDSDAAEIARDAGQAVVDPSASDVGARLAEALEKLQLGVFSRPFEAVVARYDRRHLTRGLAALFEEVLDRTSA